MTKSEAIAWAESRFRSFDFQYHVVPFNDGYCVVNDTNLKRHTELKGKIVYSTTGEKFCNSF